MPRKLRFVPAIREAIDMEMAHDDSVFVMGEDVVAGTFGVTTGLADKYGTDRVRNTPISESALVGAGLGAALAGARPIIELQFASLTYMAMDQLVNQVAKARYMTGGQVAVAMTIRAAVVMGYSAGAQHSDTPHAIFAHLPGLKVVVPSGPREARGLLRTAIRDKDPVIFFENLVLNRLTDEIPDDDELIPFGRARVARQGTDLTIVAIGSAVPIAVIVADRLISQGVSVEVIDPRTIVPMDWTTVIESARKTGRIVVVDDATPICSFASEVAATVVELAFDDLKAPIQRVTRANVPVPFSPGMENLVVLNADKVEAAARSVLEARIAR